MILTAKKSTCNQSWGFSRTIVIMQPPCDCCGDGQRVAPETLVSDSWTNIDGPGGVDIFAPPGPPCTGVQVSYANGYDDSSAQPWLRLPTNASDTKHEADPGTCP